ncbi:hypothetical protein KR222_006025, partial [Zaprionus bogoriensis]
LQIWQTTRVQRLENDLNSLKRQVESLRERLGINYLEDLNEFQKEYQNILIQDPSKLDDIDSEAEDYDEDDEEDGTQFSYDDNEDDSLNTADTDDDDDDDDAGDEETDYDDYLDMIKEETNGTSIRLPKNNTETDTSASSSASNDDNVFEDFTNYDSKKKAQRKSRSIAAIRNELQSNDVAQNQNQSRNQTRLEQMLRNSSATAETPKPHVIHHRRRKLTRVGGQWVLARKGESPVSARSVDYPAGSSSSTPAMHFHLYHKLPHHIAPIRGDMYIGRPSQSSGDEWKEHFRVHNDVLSVRQAGLYYVYAQICYNNAHDQNGFIIFHGQNAFLQCLNTVPTNMPQKIHTCHTSGLIHLQKDDTIHLRDIHPDRNVVLRDGNNRSYFGIIKI